MDPNVLIKMLQQLFSWRHFSKIEDMQNTVLNILAL